MVVFVFLLLVGLFTSVCVCVLRVCVGQVRAYATIRVCLQLPCLLSAYLNITNK